MHWYCGIMVLKSFMWKEKGKLLTFCSPSWWRRTSNHILFRILLKVLISIINWSKYDFPFHRAISIQAEAANIVYLEKYLRLVPADIRHNSQIPLVLHKAEGIYRKNCEFLLLYVKIKKIPWECSCNLKVKVFETFSGWEFPSKSYYATKNLSLSSHHPLL